MILPDKLFNIVNNEIKLKKTSKTVKKHLLHLIGLLVKKFYNDINSNEINNYIDVYIRTLNFELNASTPSTSIIEGALCGIYEIIQIINMTNGQNSDIFNIVITFITPLEEQRITNYNIIKNGLKIVKDLS
jgi:hypothetical protein